MSEPNNYVKYQWIILISLAITLVNALNLDVQDTDGLITSETKRPEPQSTFTYDKQDINYDNVINSQNNGVINDLDGSWKSPKQIVEELVEAWAPLVWLAPGEKFLPGNVKEFLQHVHAEKSKASKANLKYIKPQYYAEFDDFPPEMIVEHKRWDQRNKRMFDHRQILIDYIINLPVGARSLNWNLVTNEDIDDLLEDDNSFIYGNNPNDGRVPIYAMIKMCDEPYEIDNNEIPIGVINDRSDNNYAYIPVTLSNTAYGQENLKEKRFGIKVPTINPDGITIKPPEKIIKRRRRDTTSLASEIIENGITSPITTNKQVPPTQNVKTKNNVPTFQVTYWMFYPYSQGKAMCTWNLGPFGHIPIPTLFGMCMGSKKDFGSHIGDWEHMSLSFKGRKEPDEMYVSAHDAGAYYSYDRLTGTFEFRSQETRKGILQRPTFPRTVVTSNNHPVLFAAKGSHGLWTAPGKHRFVRVPRLYDINGFGTPWFTWKNIDISYESQRTGKAIGPKWLNFMGRWGNPKSKCHPLKRIGLNFCEFFDGPTGIPLKKDHFQCMIQ